MVQKFQRSHRQHRKSPMHRNHFFIESDQLLILLSPGIRPPVIRIRKPDLAGLIPIIQRRRPRPRHLNHNRLAQHRLIRILRSRIRPNIRHTPHTMIRSREEPRMIMIIQLIHRRIQRRRIKRRHMIRHRPDKTLTVSEKPLVKLITVLLHTREEPGNRLHKRIIVHHRIPLVALQPAHRIAVVLSQNNCLRIRLLHNAPELLPELVVKLRAVS